MAVLYGASGARKTWITIDLAMAVATNTPFLGTFPVAQSKVLYIISEGADDFEDRCFVWKHGRGVEWPDGEGFVYCPFSFDFACETEVDECARFVKDRLGGAGLLVIDTLAKNFGEDADKNSDIGRLLRHMERLRASLSATILLIHHSGWKDKHRERGGSALRAGVDTSICVASTGVETSHVKCSKQKMGPEFSPFDVSFRCIEFSTPGSDADEKSTGLVGSVNKAQKTTHGIQDAEIRTAVQSLLAERDYTKTELVEAVKKETRAPKARVKSTLETMEGQNQVFVEFQAHNKHVYSLKGGGSIA